MVHTRSKGNITSVAASAPAAPAPARLARKVKNKVGSPAARASRGLQAKAAIQPTALNYSSDEFNHSDDEDSISVKSTLSTSSARTALSDDLLHTLLTDIIDAGGIDRFDIASKQALAELCDKNVQIYGPRGDKLRERIRKKVRGFKLLKSESDDKWYALLVKHKVLARPGKTPAKENKARPGKAPAQENKDCKKRASLPSRGEIPYEIQTSSPTPPPKPPKMSNDGNTTVLRANLSAPEKNGIALLYDVPDFKGAQKGTEHRGFYFIVPYDQRFPKLDPTVDWYSANVSGTHRIQFRVPAFPYPLHPAVKGASGDSLYSAMQQTLPDEAKKAMNDRHGEFNASTDTAKVASRFWKYHTLDFSHVDGVDYLSSSLLFKNATDKEDLDFTRIKVPVLNSKGVRTHWDYYLGYKVGAVKEDPNGKKGRNVERNAVQKSRLAAMVDDSDEDDEVHDPATAFVDQKIEEQVASYKNLKERVAKRFAAEKKYEEERRLAEEERLAVLAREAKEDKAAKEEEESKNTFMDDKTTHDDKKRKKDEDDSFDSEDMQDNV